MYASLMIDKRKKNIYLKQLSLFFLSWVFFGMAYLTIIFEINFISLPLIMALIAIIISFSSLILAIIRVFKYESITLNLIIISCSVPTTVIIFVFLKFYYFFVGFTG